jgi:PAS domain S-box-containing protein
VGAGAPSADARQLLGLLHAGGARHEPAIERVARLVAEACAGVDACHASRNCAALRDSILALAEHGDLAIDEARTLCQAIDEAEAAALESSDAATHALEALEQALSTASARELPALALRGVPSADSAALLVEENGRLHVRAVAGREPGPAIAGSQSVAGRALLTNKTAEGADEEGSRAVLALPLRISGVTVGVLWVSSQAEAGFTLEDRQFLRGIAIRAATILSAEGPEARLRHTLSTFESLIDAAPLPVLFIDRQGLLRSWNRAAEELFLWQRGEAVGRPGSLIPREVASEAREIFTAVSAGTTVRGREVRWPRKDGTLLDLMLSAAPLRDATGHVNGSIAVLMDITDRKRREEETQRTARFREHFVGVLGHDLRNPLTAIVTSAQLLLRYGDLPERQSKVVGRVATSADRMARMIDDLLDFARSRLGGGFPIHPQRIDLRTLCEQVVEELEFAYTRAIPVDAQGDLWGNWDPDRTAQAVSNLVGNAIQHSGAEVHVRLRGDADTVTLQTHNRGPPIPPEVLPHVFEPGRRGPSRAGGLGLGLFIVQQIVLAHGGTIDVKSTAQTGTVFTVRLPRKARHKG